MATHNQIKALVRAHAAGDDDAFYQYVLQIAASAAAAKRETYARELRDIVEKAKNGGATRATQRASPLPEKLASVVAESWPRATLSALVLHAELRGRLDRVLAEQRSSTKLLEHGLSPLRKLLLVGPPGVGKTLTASALAGELGLPLLRIQLDGLITQYLGQTAATLRQVFNLIASRPGVYLFDEIDAIGARRGTSDDVGEMRRVVNSFLQFLDDDASDSIIVGTTNMRGILDSALFRRFDDVLEYGLPSPSDVEAIMRSRLSSLDASDVVWETVARAAGSLSHAEVVRACDCAAKAAVLSGSSSVDEQTLHAEIESRVRMRAGELPE